VPLASAAVTALSQADLAERSGIAPDRIRDLAGTGVLSRREEPFEPADINRVRLAEALVSSGIALEDIRLAVDGGGLSFGFIGDLFPEPVDYVPGTTFGEFASEHGIPMELIQQVHDRLGLARPEPGHPLRSDEAQYMPLATMALGAGLSDAGLIRFSRVMGENLRRLAEAQVHFFTSEVIDRMIDSGVTPLQAWEQSTAMGSQMRPLFRELLTWVYERHQETYILDQVIEHMEDVLRGRRPMERSAARDQAIAFLDLSGFTRLTEERGDQVAAELAANLADLVQSATRPYAGAPVKLLGDGVMFHFAEPASAVRCSLELVARAPEQGLPPAHVGVNVGPVVFRDGDYFGRTVNVAARVADRAGPHEVLVTDDVVRATPEGVARFHPIGPVELKGVSAPLGLHLAEPVAS
jgi:adenylate cyclase